MIAWQKPTCWAVAAVSLAVLCPGARADSMELAPDVQEVLPQTWIGMSDSPPHSIYKLVVQKDGSGHLLIHHRLGVLDRWDIASVRIDGRIVHFTFLPSKANVDRLGATGEIDVWVPLLTLTMRWVGRADLPERKVVLLSEKQVNAAFAAFEREKEKTPNKPSEGTR